MAEQNGYAQFLNDHVNGPITPDDTDLSQQPTADQPLQTLGGYEAFREQHIQQASPPKTQAPIRPRDTYDVTLGAAEYGGAETAGLLAKGVNRSFYSSDNLVQFADTMEKFKQDHPEYAPVEVNSALDLLSNPAALSSRVFSGAPMLLGTAAAAAVPTIGIPLAATLAYTIEAQRGYEGALADGATEEQATTAGRYMGVTNAAIQVLTDQRVINFAKGTEGAFAREVARRAKNISTAGRIGADLAGEAGMVALYASIQGAVDEGIANITYGKKVEDGFFDRRIQDAIGGAAGGLVFGVTGKGVRELKQSFKSAEGKTVNVALNVYDRDSFQNYLQAKKGVDKKSASALASIADSFARNWADRHDRPVPEFYGSYVQDENVTKGSVGDHISKDLEQVPRIFLSSDPVKVVKSLTEVMANEIGPADSKIFKKYLGSTDPQVLGDNVAKYLKDGTAPSPELVEPFETMKQVMKDAYYTTKDVARDKIPLELQGALDRMFSVDTDQIAEARTKLGEAKSIVEKLSAPDVTAEEVAKTSPLKALQDVEDLSLQLRTLQLSREIPNTESTVARRVALDGTAREVLRSEGPIERKDRNKFQQAFDWTYRWLDESAALLGTRKWGQKTRDMLSDVNGIKHQLIGEWAKSHWEAYNELGAKDKDWLNSVEGQLPDGTPNVEFSNFHRFIELSGGTPNPILQAPSEALQRYREQIRSLNNTMGTLAERDGTTFKLPDGSVIPYSQPKDLKMIRLATPWFREQMKKGAGPGFDAIKEALERLNKDSGTKVTATNTDELLGATGISRSGPLSDGRAWKVVPTQVMVDGKPQQLLHTQPYRYLVQSTDAQAYQIGWNRIMRQNHLEKVTRGDLKQFAEEMGVSPVFNINNLVDNFKAAGLEVPEQYKNDFKELKKLARSSANKIDTGPKWGDYRDAIDGINPASLSESQVGTLREYAKDIKGVDPNANPINLLDEVRRRLVEKPVDVIKTLKDNYNVEGGSPSDIDHIVKLSQGLPVYGTGGEGLSAIPRKLISRVIGIVQTSGRVVLHIPQALIEIPQMGGLINYLNATQKTLANKNATEDFLIHQGAITNVNHAWGFEKGNALLDLGRNIQRAFETATGMKWVQDYNNTVAGETFHGKAEKWKNGGFRDSDIPLAQSLRLTPEQITNIRQGKMDDLTYSKIIQNGVARTMYMGENAANRGRLENSPLTSFLFSYNSYATGAARASIEYAKNMYSAVKSGNPEQLAKAAWRTTLLLGGSLGAGVMSQMLRNLYRGDVSHEDDETTLQKMTGAILSTHLLGPAQRMLDASRYDQGSLDKYLTGLMPKIRAIADGVGLLLNMSKENNYGKFGNFPASDQAKMAMLQNTPILKAFSNWSENIAYPDLQEYREVRAKSQQYITNVLKIPPQPGETKANPEYDKVEQWVKRGDIEEAMKAAGEYYENFFNNLDKHMVEDPENPMLMMDTMTRAREGLRASLEARAPIHVNAKLTSMFLSTLKDDQATKAMEAHMKYMAIVNSVAPRATQQ